MCWTQVAVFPQASLAVQVRSIPPRQPVICASVLEITGAPPQLSLAVAVPVLLGSVESPHSRPLSAGQVITGGVVSTNRMRWTQGAVVQQTALAVRVRSIPFLL